MPGCVCCVMRMRELRLRVSYRYRIDFNRSVSARRCGIQKDATTCLLTTCSLTTKVYEEFWGHNMSEHECENAWSRCVRILRIWWYDWALKSVLFLIYEWDVKGYWTGILHVEGRQSWSERWIKIILGGYAMKGRLLIALWGWNDFDKGYDLLWLDSRYSTQRSFGCNLVTRGWASMLSMVDQEFGLCDLYWCGFTWCRCEHN